MSKEIVAMILAGGRGTRLEALTAKVAKPAVYFGGKYRIIDFPLSNCANSGIDIVGVLTQYESVLLGSYVGAGSKWGLDGNNSLAANLPARERGEVGATWYAGTADAIYQNIPFEIPHAVVENCCYYNDSNLIGALYNYLIMYQGVKNENI